MNQILTWFRKKEDIVIAIFLFLIVLIIYVKSANTPLSDTMWAVHISSSLLNSGDINLDEFEQFVEDANNFGVISGKYNDQIVPFFPVGNSIIGAPILWVIERISPPPNQQSLYQYLQQTSPSDAYLIWTQHVIAAIIAAMTAPLFYFIGRIQFKPRVAFVAVLIFAFGSSTYSVASRVLWQHGPSMLMLTLTLWLFLKGQKNPRMIRWAGIPLAFSYVIRPTNSISIFVLTLLVLLYYRKQILGYLIGAAVVAIPFLLLNQHVYQSWISPYYLPQRVGFSSTFWVALLGNIISPSRGLFVYSPVLLFVGHGIYVKLRGKQWRPFDTAVTVIIFLHWLLISSFGHWYGGHSFGPRFFSDLLPYLFYLLLPSLNWLMASPLRSTSRRVGIVIFTLFALISVAIHYVGANETAVNAWNNVPVSLDSHPTIRLWDWTDVQFMRTKEDWPIHTARSFIWQDRSSDEPDSFFPLYLHNQGDIPYSWEIKVPETVKVMGNSAIDFRITPSGFPVVVGKNPLLSEHGQLLKLEKTFDVNKIEDASLGAVAIKTMDAQEQSRAVQIIPISMSKFNNEWRTSFAVDPFVWLPEDITVNSEIPTYELYGHFGVGWYLLEKFDPYQWRWARSPAELYIFSGKPSKVTFSFSITEIYDETSENSLGDSGLLHIQIGEQQFNEEIIRGQFNQVAIELDSGWNVLTFDLESGNFSPSEENSDASDRRMLSFALSSLDIALED